MKPRMLFLDDRTERIHSALRQYSEDYHLTIVTNVKECLRYLSSHEFEEVHLDCDLGGDDFQSLQSENHVMQVVNYMQQTGWVRNKKKPRFVIHSSNQFAACALMLELNKLGLFAVYERFIYDEKQYHAGIVAGVFDLIHPGYVRMFRDAKAYCEYLIVALQAENPDKPKPVFSVEERREILLSIKYVDEVRIYRTEEELDELLILLGLDVRFLGEDYATGEKKITGAERCPIVYLERAHEFSNTAVRQKIKEAK